jgi:tRNA pseudouridine55 synthase
MNAHGFLVIDKPTRMTSRDVVNRVQKWWPRKTKFGHAGTLDPLATGVLVVAVGHATRLIEYVQVQAKTYHTRIVLGARSTTDDADGTITPCAASPVSDTQLRAELAKMIGTIAQVPPAFSAAHIDGQRAYALARQGAHVQLAPRFVRIDRIDISTYQWPVVELTVACGKGTYIRSIARDLGEHLQVGGYVQELRRTAIGSFVVADAVTLATPPEEVRQRLRPMTEALATWPHVHLKPADVQRVRYGQLVPVTHDEGPLAVRDIAGDLVAVGVVAAGMFKPDKVIPVD